jgi:hypothetical protein
MEGKYIKVYFNLIGLIGQCYLLSALTYVMDMTVITK